MKIYAFFALASVVFVGESAIAEQASPDIFQITTVFSIAAGVSAVEKTLTVSPSNKRMVIQAVAVLRSHAVLYSDLNSYLITDIFGTTSYFPLQTSTSTASVSGGTTFGTIYGGAGSAVLIYVNRNGDLTQTEDEFVTISGYYVEKP